VEALDSEILRIQNMRGDVMTPERTGRRDDSPSPGLATPSPAPSYGSPSYLSSPPPPEISRDGTTISRDGTTPPMISRDGTTPPMISRDGTTPPPPILDSGAGVSLGQEHHEEEGQDREEVQERPPKEESPVVDEMVTSDSIGSRPPALWKPGEAPESLEPTGTESSPQNLLSPVLSPTEKRRALMAAGLVLGTPVLDEESGEKLWEVVEKETFRQANNPSPPENEMQKRKLSLSWGEGISTANQYQNQDEDLSLALSADSIISRISDVSVPDDLKPELSHMDALNAAMEHRNQGTAQ